VRGTRAPTGRAPLEPTATACPPHRPTTAASAATSRLSRPTAAASRRGQTAGPPARVERPAGVPIVSEDVIVHDAAWIRAAPHPHGASHRVCLPVDLLTEDNYFTGASHALQDILDDGEHTAGPAARVANRHTHLSAAVLSSPETERCLRTRTHPVPLQRRQESPVVTFRNGKGKRHHPVMPNAACSGSGLPVGWQADLGRQAGQPVVGVGWCCGPFGWLPPLEGR
jgi:hypothetical protein